MKQLTDKDIQTILLFVEGKLSPEETALVRSRIQRDTVFAKEVADFQQDNDLLGDLVASQSAKQSQTEYMAQIWEKINAQETSRHHKKWFFTMRVWATGAAACIALAWFCLHPDQTAIISSAYAMDVQDIYVSPGNSVETYTTEDLCMEIIVPEEDRVF